MHPDKLLKRRDVQRRLSISHTKFFDLVKSGRIEAVKLDGELRVRESVLRAFEAQLPKARATTPEVADAGL